MIGSLAPWLDPLSLTVGVLFVATSAYLAAVFLISDARRRGDSGLERYFATRALAAALVAGAAALGGIFALHGDARYVAQHPYPLPGVLKIVEGAGSDATLVAVLIVFAVAVLLVLPALGLLFTLGQRSVLDE